MFPLHFQRSFILSHSFPSPPISDITLSSYSTFSPSLPFPSHHHPFISDGLLHSPIPSFSSSLSHSHPFQIFQFPSTLSLPLPSHSHPTTAPSFPTGSYTIPFLPSSHSHPITLQSYFPLSFYSTSSPSLPFPSHHYAFISYISHSFPLLTFIPFLPSPPLYPIPLLSYIFSLSFYSMSSPSLPFPSHHLPFISYRLLHTPIPFLSSSFNPSHP